MTPIEYFELFMLYKETGVFHGSETFESAEFNLGDFIVVLYETLEEDNEMEPVTEHIERLYQTANHYGLIYFIIMLADTVSIEPPKQMIYMSFKEEQAAHLSGMLMESWIDIEG